MNMSAAQKIESLRKKIRHYDALYYGRGISEIPDGEYDTLYRELKALEDEHPHLVTPDSPTRRVGNDLTTEFPKVTHRLPMLSIDNTYDDEDIREWIGRCQKMVMDGVLTYIGELKLDGVAVSLHYEKGRLVRGVTRGNGVVGDDVTANIKTVRSIPLVVDFPGSFELRGELYMTYEAFAHLNERQIENGENPMQNPRNTTAGTIKLQDSREVARRRLSFAAHYLLNHGSDGHTSDTHSANLRFLERIGIPTVIHSPPLQSLDEIIDFCRKWREERFTLGFPVDGVVVKVDSLSQQKVLGATTKSPRWVIAFKYPPEQARTRVVKIDAQVGRTGVITPIARLEPVFLAGTTIKNASLHNYNEIKRLGLREGDTAEIEKGGEIIPKVVTVLPGMRPPGSVPFNPPLTCPSCGSSLSRIEGEVALRCVNSSCPAQLAALLKHFVSRNAMDIRNLGPALLEQLLEEKLVSSVADIYLLTQEQLARLERMGAKSAGRVIDSIEASKHNSLDRLLHGLGIRMIGAQAAKVLAQNVNDIEDLFTMSAEQLSAIETIGPAMAQSLRFYFDKEENRELLHRLRRYGISMKGMPEKERQGIFSGKTVVLTGTLTRFTRDEAKTQIEVRGGKVTSGISARTNYLVTGESPGSKRTKAEKLGVPVIDEDQFLSLLEKKEHSQTG